MAERLETSRQKQQGRMEQVVDTVRDELVRFRSGELKALSTNVDLINMFGYSSVSSILRILRPQGLLEERRIVRHERAIRRLSPSPEVAWLLGVLGGGHVYYGKNKGAVYLDHSDLGLRNKFAAVGEQIFGVNASLYESQNRVHFSDSYTARALGDFRSSHWPETIINRFGWIMSNPYYAWRFTEGVFDRRGAIYAGKRNHKVIFTTTHQNVASFLAETLAKLGVSRPRLWHTIREKEGMGGVVVSNIPDLKLISDNIHSCIDWKEERLRFYRELPTQAKMVVSINPSNQEVMDEWRRLAIMLSHPPSFPEIQKLKRARRTRFFPEVYKKRFGRTEKGRSYALASRTLNNLIFIQNINEALSEYEHESGIQIHYVNKLHRIRMGNLEEVGLRLDEIRSSVQQSHDSMLLYGLDHSPLI